MSRQLVQNTPFCSFEHYTDEMYLGNAPSSKGHAYLVNGEEVVSDLYSCKYGSAEVVNNEVMNASINLDSKTEVVIIGDLLSVQVMRRYKNFAIWKYWSNKDYWNPNLVDYGENAKLNLEMAEKILDKLDRCYLDSLVKYKAKELLIKYLLTNE